MWNCLPYPTLLYSLFDSLPIYYLLSMDILNSAFLGYTITQIVAKIQTNLDKYLFLIFQNISNNILKNKKI